MDDGHLRPGPVEAHSAGDDHLVRGEGGQQEVGGGGAGLHTQGDPLEEVMNTKRKHDQESSGCCLYQVLNPIKYNHKKNQTHFFLKIECSHLTHVLFNLHL